MNGQTQKIRLLIAVHRLNVGGVQKSLLSALRALDYDRFSVTLYVRKNRVELLDRVDERVERVIVNTDPTHYYRKPRAVLYYLLFRLAGLFKRDKTRWKKKLDAYIVNAGMRYEQKHYFPQNVRYDVAVSYIQGYTAAFVADRVPADRKIVFYHGSVDENHALHERIFPAYDRIVAVNEGCRAVLRGLYPAQADKIGYLENYVDAGAVLAAAKEYTVDRRGKTAVLCTCGRFSAEKGCDLAVGAAKLLKDRSFDFLWYFVGDGDLRSALEDAVKNTDLEDTVCFTGMQSNPYPYIANCDIYVQPSYEESYGLAVAEAQILCRPIVTTATVGGKSMVRDGVTGLVSGFSAEDLAKNISRLLADQGLCAAIRGTLCGIDRSGEAQAYKKALSALLGPEGEDGR